MGNTVAVEKFSKFRQAVACSIAVLKASGGGLWLVTGLHGVLGEQDGEVAFP